MSLRVSLRRPLLAVVAAITAVAAAGGACDCSPPVPPPPELEVLGTGFFTGEVYIGDASIDGATIEVAGVAARATSEAGKLFVLLPVPVGEHTISVLHAPTKRARRFKATIAAANQTVQLSKEDTTLQDPVTITGTIDIDGPGTAAGATVFVVGGTSAEVTLAGDDGSFTLENVPPGEIVIAASQDGFNLAQLPFVAEPGVQALPDPIVLVPLDDPNATTTVTGNVKAADRTDHAGTLVIVDGEAVASTDSEGNFEIDVAPGHHEFVTERPGHDPVTLPTAGTDEDGNVAGVVDMFVAPGDTGGGAGDVIVAPGAALDIEFPVAGSDVVVGVPALFTVNAEGVGADDVASIQWTVAPLDDPASVVLLDSGAVISAVLPPEFAEQQLVVTATLAGAELVDAVAVVGAPLFSPDVRLGVDGDLVLRPVIAADPADGVLRVDIAEGHPVVVVAESAVTGTIVWTEGAQQLGTDALDLGQFEEGTHIATATLANADGSGASLDLRVVVAPFTFEAVVDEPTVGITYFTDEPLPLRAAFVHPWQLSFPAQAVRWSDLDGAQLGLGLVTSTRSAPQGAQLLQLEMSDVVGNRAAVFGEYLYTPITFTAAFNSPANNVTVLEADNVTFNVSFSHPTLAADDAIVTLSSSIQGQITDVAGNTTFAPNSDIVVSALVPGAHQITARVLGQGRVASVTQALTVDADFVTANLQAPASVLAIDGTSMRFEVVVGSTPGITPRVTWLVDGEPFVNAWDVDGDYNAANPQAAGNTVVNLGVYDTDTPPVAFLDPRWAPGTHTVQAWVRLPNDPNAEASGCVNNGSISRCLSFSLTVFPSLEEKAGAADVTLTAGQVETWQGGILLKGSYTIDGGTLIIQPGTVVVVDMADRVNPTQQDAASQRFIQLNDGNLQIGAPGGVPPVRIEVRRSFIPQNRWQGIRTSAQTAGVGRNLSLQNVIIGDATSALDFNGGGSLRGPDNTLVLEDITIERANSAAVLACPASFARITVRDSASGVTLVDDALCPDTWGIDGAVFVDTDGGISFSTAREADVSFTNLSFSGGSFGQMLNVTGTASVLVADSTFEGGLATIALRYAGSGDTGGLRVERNTFVDGNLAVQTSNSTGKRMDFVDNTFERNTRAMQLFGVLEDDINVHMNRFLDNDDDVQLPSQPLHDVDAHGNFWGDPGDASTAAGRMAAVAPGVVPTLPTISDVVTNANVMRVRSDNFLETEDVPLAVIRLPESTASYNPNLCLPLVAVAPRSDVDIDVVNDCTWSLFNIGGDPASGSPLTPTGANGCAAENVGSGDHGVALTCVDPDTGAETTHTTRIRVSPPDVYAGRVTAPGFTLTGDVLVDGDLIVDPDAVLTIAAGTTVRFALTDRDVHHEPGLAGGIVGNRTRPDIFVRGTLLVQGTAAAPVELVSDAAEGLSLWGGIVADADATVAIEHTIVESADEVLFGQVPDDAFRAPTITVRNATLSSITGFARGVCPTDVEDTDATFVNDDVFRCTLAADLNVARSSFLDVRGGGSAFEVTEHTTTAPSLVIVDSAFSANTNAGFAFNLGDVRNTSFTRSSSDGWSTVFALFDGQLTLLDATVENFTSAAFLHVSTGTVMQIDHSTIRGGPRIAQGRLELFVLRDSLIEDVNILFDNVSPDAIDGLTFTGNEVRNAATVLDVFTFTNTVGVASWNMTGNNFIGITDNVFAVRGTPSSFVTRVDLDGSFFGAGNDTIAEISALLDDTRTDANANDTVEGNTDFTGFVTSPLSLDTP